MMKKLLLMFGFAFLTCLAVKAESTVYLLLLDKENMNQVFTAIVEGANNGTVEIERAFLKTKLGGRLTYYGKAMRKCLFKNDGRTTISYSFTNVAGTSDWSDSITLDLQDGDTYYIQLITGNNKYQIKELTEKEFQKETKKISTFNVNPEYIGE